MANDSRHGRRHQLVAIAMGALFGLLSFIGAGWAAASRGPSPRQATQAPPEFVGDNASSAKGITIETRIYVPPGHKVLRGILVSSPGFGGDTRGFATGERAKTLASQWGFAALGVKFPSSGGRYIRADKGSGQALIKSINAHAASSKLKPLRETEGYLGDNQGLNQPAAKVASFQDYQGDRGLASWLPSQAFAQRWQACVSREGTCPED